MYRIAEPEGYRDGDGEENNLVTCQMAWQHKNKIIICEFSYCASTTTQELWRLANSWGRSIRLIVNIDTLPQEHVCWRTECEREEVSSSFILIPYLLYCVCRFNLQCFSRCSVKHIWLIKQDYRCVLPWWIAVTYVGVMWGMYRLKKHCFIIINRIIWPW